MRSVESVKLCLENYFDQVILEILQSKVPYYVQTHQDKITYLFDCIANIFAAHQELGYKLSDVEPIIKDLFNSIVLLACVPMTYDINLDVEEVPNDLNDKRNIFVQQIYQIILQPHNQVQRDAFCKYVLEN